MRIGLLAPIAWRVPPRHYGPWERVVGLLADALVARGLDVTLFATLDSETSARLDGVCPRPYEEDPSVDAGVWTPLHVGHAFEQARGLDVLHSHLDFTPLAFAGLLETPLVTTVHGFSSDRILPAYRRANDHTFYVSISDADRHPDLAYAATIYHGLDAAEFSPGPGGEGLVFFGRIHPDKGAAEAVEIARRAGRPLTLAGIVQDAAYFRERVEPHLSDTVRYVGSVGPAERDRLLGASAALLHPIFFDEPFGLSVAEAMLCGTPVVAASRGSMPEVVDDGVTGVLVDPARVVESSLERLPEALALDRRAVRARAVARFSSDRMASEYAALYHAIVAGEIAPTARGPLARPDLRR